MPKFGKTVNYSWRVKHPIVRKVHPNVNGKVFVIPLTTSKKEKSHKHRKLGKLKIGRSSEDGNHKGDTYAVDRVITEQTKNISKNKPARITRQQNKILNKIFRKRLRKKSNKKG